jgi:acetate kinase
MDSVLVVNAGSSSIKFELFAGADGKSLIDRAYDAAAIPDAPAAMQTTGAWLREEHRTPPSAVGHRVVHGGPEYNSPVVIDMAFARLIQAGVGAVVVTADPFTSRRHQIVALAARHAIPAVYEWREFTAAGGFDELRAQSRGSTSPPWRLHWPNSQRDQTR